MKLRQLHDASDVKGETGPGANSMNTVLISFPRVGVPDIEGAAKWIQASKSSAAMGLGYAEEPFRTAV